MTTVTILALAKLLGKTSEVMSQDLANIYQVGRDKIVQAAIRKIKNSDDGAVANLRVARDVFLNGSYSDESICAEYFGGILAASRSGDGKDDMGVFYIDIIKSLSSGQLKTHYIIYRTLNKMFLSDETKKSLNPGQESELQGVKLTFSLVEIQGQFGNEDLGAILYGLNAKGLVKYFQTGNHKLDSNLYIPHLTVTPTPLGIQLFAIANNMFADWSRFSITDFGDFPDVSLPEFYADTVDKMLENVGVGRQSVPSA
jgi:hypothetical protein